MLLNYSIQIQRKCENRAKTAGFDGTTRTRLSASLERGFRLRIRKPPHQPVLREQTDDWSGIYFRHSLIKSLQHVIKRRAATVRLADLGEPNLPV